MISHLRKWRLSLPASASPRSGAFWHTLHGLLTGILSVEAVLCGAGISCQLSSRPSTLPTLTCSSGLQLHWWTGLVPSWRWSSALGWTQWTFSQSQDTAGGCPRLWDVWRRCTPSWGRPQSALQCPSKTVQCGGAWRSQVVCSTSCLWLQLQWRSWCLSTADSTLYNNRYSNFFGNVSKSPKFGLKVVGNSFRSARYLPCVQESSACFNRSQLDNQKLSDNVKETTKNVNF